MADVTSPTSESGGRTEWAFALGLLTVLILAAGLRLYRLGEPDYWLDELHSLANSAGRRAEFESPPHGAILAFSPSSTTLTSESTWPGIWRGMRADTHPPAYFLLLLSWRRMVGDGEFAVRLLPTFFSILSLVPIALMLRDFRRPMAGVAVAALLAVTFSHIRFAQDNRPYSLAIFLLAISFWTLTKMLLGWDGLSRRQRGMWALAYGMAAYLSVMTHYFTGAALAGQAVVMVTHRRGPLRRVWVIVVAAVIAAFGLTWGAPLVAQWTLIADQEVWLLDRHPDHILRTVLGLLDVPIRLLFWHKPYEPQYLPCLAGAVLLGATMIALKRRTDVAARLFALWYIMPVLFFAAIDLITGMRLLTQLRYVAVATPGLVGLIAITAGRLRGVGGWVVIAVAGLALALTLHLPTPLNPRGRRAAEYIAQQWRPGDLLVFDGIGWPLNWARRTYQIAAYYLPEFTPAKPPVALMSQPPDAELREAMAAFDRLIVVSSRVGESPNPIPGVFRHVDKTGNVLFMGELHLFERAHQSP